MKKDKIIIRNENEDKEFYKLIQFKDKSTNKEFIITPIMYKDTIKQLKLIFAHYFKSTS